MRIGLDAAWRGKCILAFEDNAINQLVLEHTLGAVGIPFHIADDGELGIAAYRKLDRVLVLMDISMPRMDGFTATGLIRAMESREGDGRRVPIIALTAHALTGDRDRCMEAGMDDYIAKPISPAHVQQKIRQWLGDRQPELAAG